MEAYYEHEPEYSTVRVFRDDPCWDRHAKWWMVPMHVVQSLYVCAYTVDDGRFSEHLTYIEGQHPGCVFVY